VEHRLFWTTGDRLLPAWGFYPNGSSYRDTEPSGKASAWTAGGGTHTLTWVADFPAAAPWQVWVRQYGGYGKVTAAVDEWPVTEGRGGFGGGRYVWRHLGGITVSAGPHHVDLTVTHSMLDAVLFATDPALDPANVKLPEPVENPVLRGLRTYRDDRHLSDAAGSAGFVVGRVTPYAEVRYDWLPQAKDLIDRIRLWGAAGQYVAGTVAVRAREPLAGPRVTLNEVIGPQGTKLGSKVIDLRVVHLRHRSMSLPATRPYSDKFPDLLLRDDRTGLPPKGDQGGYQSTAPWAYQDYPDSRLYTEPAHAVAYPDQSGRPIPTIRWEAMRDGIDDVRYLQALDRAIAAAEARLTKADPPPGLAPALDRARQVRKDCFEAISGRWFQYTGSLLPGDLDQTRRRLAEAGVGLRRSTR